MHPLSQNREITELPGPSWQPFGIRKGRGSVCTPAIGHRSGFHPRRLPLSWLMALALALFTCALSARADPSDTFDRANRLYEQGKYSDAIAVYQELAQANEISPALYFNLANALFKNGQTGQAIYHYRLAQRLAPRDPDIRANLRFARESVPGGARPPGRLERWLNLLSLNELTLIAVVVLWSWLLLLALGQFRRDWARSLRIWQRFLGVATVLFGAWLGVLLQDRLGSPAAVVVAKEATVRYGPFEEAQSSYTFRDGTELAVLDRKDQWLQVTDHAARTGWLREEDVAQLPPG